MGDYRQRLGRQGEAWAASYLQDAGYEILHRNWRCPAGEIDIVARLGVEIAGILQTPDVRERLAAQGAEVAITTPEEFGRFLGELGVPVYYYEDAATRPERTLLSSIRKGQYEALERVARQARPASRSRRPCASSGLVGRRRRVPRGRTPACRRC